jgi:hypothetical protein
MSVYGIIFRCEQAFNLVKNVELGRVLPMNACRLQKENTRKLNLALKD